MLPKAPKLILVKDYLFKVHWIYTTHLATNGSLWHENNPSWWILKLELAAALTSFVHKHLKKKNKKNFEAKSLYLFPDCPPTPMSERY